MGVKVLFSKSDDNPISFLYKSNLYHKKLNTLLYSSLGEDFHLNVRKKIKLDMLDPNTSPFQEYSCCFNFKPIPMIEMIDDLRKHYIVQIDNEVNNR